jgi:hypothetical protein
VTPTNSLIAPYSLFISKCIALTETPAIRAISPASCPRILINCSNHALLSTSTRNTPSRYPTTVPRTAIVLPQATGHAATSLSSSHNEFRLWPNDRFSKSRIPSIAEPHKNSLADSFIEIQTLAASSSFGNCFDSRFPKPHPQSFPTLTTACDIDPLLSALESSVGTKLHATNAQLI